MEREIEELRRQHFEIAMQEMQKKNYDKAHGYFSMAAEKEPIWPEAIFRRGQMRFYRNNTWGATEDVVHALELEPALSNLFEVEGFTKEFVLKTLNSRACRLIEAKNFSEAKTYLDAALKLDEAYAMAILTMAEMYVEQGDYDLALHWIEHAVKKAPEIMGKIDGYSCFAPLRPYQTYGKLLGMVRQISENAKLCFTSGEEYLTKNQYDNALKCFEEALEQEENWPEALYYCGYAKYKMVGSSGVISELLLQSGGVDDIAKALDYEPELISQAEKDFELNSVTNALNDRVIDVYLPEGKFEEAISDLKLCIRINPTHVYPYLTMAEVYVVSENVDLALEWLQKAILTDVAMKEKIDGFSCFAPLRTNATYRELFVKETMPGKSYYQLLMIVEPGGMREYFHMSSGNVTHIRQAILARLKMDFGLYTLLSYGQSLFVKRFREGVCEAVIDLHPFIQVTIPGEINAHFDSSGQAIIEDMDGNAVSDAYLSDLLFDYLSDEEEQDTVFLGDFESVIGILAGEILTEGEEYIGEDGCCYNADTLIEEESGEEYPLEEFLDMARR